MSRQIQKSLLLCCILLTTFELHAQTASPGKKSEKANQQSTAAAPNTVHSAPPKPTSVLITQLSEGISTEDGITKLKAERLFKFFASNTLFNPAKDKHKHNNCEDRANAMSMLLDIWQVPHCKVWLFNKSFTSKDVVLPGNGTLKNNWAYHVAIALQVEDRKHVVDPVTLDRLSEVEVWAEKNTGKDTSFYLYTPGKAFMYNKDKKLTKSSWYPRTIVNFYQTMQGLAGHNGANWWVRNTMWARNIAKTRRQYMFIEKPDFI